MPGALGLGLLGSMMLGYVDREMLNFDGTVIVCFWVGWLGMSVYRRCTRFTTLLAGRGFTVLYFVLLYLVLDLMIP